MRRIIVLLALTLAAGVAGAQPNAKNFVAHLSGGEEVPIRETAATGQAIFQLTSGGLAYRLIVANIDNAFMAHIHLGVLGVNGPIVAFLYGPQPAGGGRIQGVIGEGVITSADLVGPLAGQDLSVLIEAMVTGGAYVNVHTNDGVGDINTGPGDFPGGEIRGQIRALGRTAR